MNGSELVFIVTPIVIPLVLIIGIALPFIADSRAGLRRPATHPERSEKRGRVNSRAPDHEFASSVSGPSIWPPGSPKYDPDAGKPWRTQRISPAGHTVANWQEPQQK